MRRGRRRAGRRQSRSSGRCARRSSSAPVLVVKSIWLVGRSPMSPRQSRPCRRASTKLTSASRMNWMASVAAPLSSTVTAIVSGSVAGPALKTSRCHAIFTNPEIRGGQPGDRLAASVHHADVDFAVPALARLLVSLHLRPKPEKPEGLAGEGRKKGAISQYRPRFDGASRKRTAENYCEIRDLWSLLC